MKYLFTEKITEMDKEKGLQGEIVKDGIQEIVNNFPDSLHVQCSLW